MATTEEFVRAVSQQLAELTVKVNAILASLTTAPQPAAVYETPELFASQIAYESMDGTTVQRDGSTWAIGVGDGKPYQLIYGYVNKAKDPPLWAAMVQIMGGDEDHLKASVGEDPWTRHKVNPITIVNGGQPNMNQLGYIFSNPLPPYPQ